MITGPKKTISVLLPEDLYQELSVLAKDSSRPLSAYIRQVLKAHLQYLQRFPRDQTWGHPRKRSGPEPGSSQTRAVGISYF